MHIVCSTWSIERTISGATTPGQSWPESGGNEGIVHIHLSSKAGALSLDCLESYLGHSLRGGVLPFGRDAVGVFYSPSQLSYR